MKRHRWGGQKGECARCLDCVAIRKHVRIAGVDVMPCTGEVGIDECPVRGCGSWVPGIDPAEIHEDEEFECTSGHELRGVVNPDGTAWLVYDGRRTPRWKGRARG